MDHDEVYPYHQGNHRVYSGASLIFGSFGICGLGIFM